MRILIILLALSNSAFADSASIPASDVNRVRCDGLVKRVVAVFGYARPGTEKSFAKLAVKPIGIDLVTLSGPNEYMYSLNDCPDGDDSCNDEVGSFGAKVFVGAENCFVRSVVRAN